MSTLVSVRDLHKNYGSTTALAGISFEVEKGQRFGLVGADGAGKSTCLRILAGLEQAPGEVQWAKRELQLGWMPQKFSLYGDLSVLENLDFYGQVYGLGKSERLRRAEELLHFVHLWEFKQRRAAALSGGMKQKLALSCALIHQPQVLLLDEPTVGVDPVSRQDFAALLQELRTQGMTVVMSTPYMDEGAACDQVALFHQGRILMQGPPQKLCQDLPMQLWEISFAHSTHFSMQSPLPPGIDLIYPAAGQLRCFTTKDLSLSEVKKTLEDFFPSMQMLQPCAVELEDLLIWTLGGKS